jgi:Putative metallopeptidase
MRVAAVLGSLLVVIALWLWGAQNLAMIARSGNVEGRPLRRGARRSAIPSHVEENVMRAVLMLVITWMVLSPEIVTTTQAAPARANRVSVSYVPPKNPAHQPIYDQLKEVSFLEKLQQFLSPFRLPRALLVKVEGCDGDANAFYENNVITICYEYVEQLRKTMPAETTAAGVTPIDAIVGPLFDTSLHEFAHALFEMLRLPVLGREEDAADQVSAYSNDDPKHDLLFHDRLPEAPAVDRVADGCTEHNPTPPNQQLANGATGRSVLDTQHPRF